MEIPLPHPADSGERHENLGGTVIGLIPLLAVKCAVYRKKLAEDGIELAAKDLSDLTELLKIHGPELTADATAGYPPAIVEVLKSIRSKVIKKR